MPVKALLSQEDVENQQLVMNLDFALGVQDLEIHQAILERTTRGFLPDTTEVSYGFNQCINATRLFLKRRSGNHALCTAQQKRTQNVCETQISETKANANWQLKQMNYECMRLQDKVSELREELARKINKTR